MLVQPINTMPIYGINFCGKQIKANSILKGVSKMQGSDSVNFSSEAKNGVKKVIIMLGAPNSGKGTYARQISAKYSLPQISTGDILRNEVKNGTELGRKAQDFMNSGGLVPDDLIIDIFKSRIAMQDCSRGYILDGFPRTVQQAEKLDALLKQEKNTEVKVINLDVDESILYERSAKRYMCSDCSRTYSLNDYNPESSKCTCGGKLIKRADDTPEILAKRLESYRKQSLPLLDFYSDKLNNVDVHPDNNQADAIIKRVFDII